MNGGRNVLREGRLQVTEYRLKWPDRLRAALRELTGGLAGRTKITVHGRYSHEGQPDVLLVENDSTHMGMLVFGITTKSHNSIAISKVEIDVPAELLLMDPLKMGFFRTRRTGSVDFPVTLVSEEPFQSRSSLLHVFALIAQFPEHVRTVPIVITIYARALRLDDYGIETVGCEQRTQKRYRVTLVDEPLCASETARGRLLATVQPFLIKCGLTASEYRIPSANPLEGERSVRKPDRPERIGSET